MNVNKILWRIALSALLQGMVAETYAEDCASRVGESTAGCQSPTQAATPMSTAMPTPIKGGASTAITLPGTRVNSPSDKLQDMLKNGQSAKAEAIQNPDQINPIPEAQYKNEFQDFVAQSTGAVLPLFGYDLFRNKSNTFAPLDNVPVTQDYVIGPGDELIISVWGQVEVSQSLEVDRNGMINLPKIGPVSVVGVRYQNLQSHLKLAVSKMYRNFELNVTLGKLRAIQIFVVGQAARPGNYTVSSLSTLVNALFASGGPSAIGSMRHIQLKRGNQVVTEFDMYDLLLKGDKSKDVQLLPGDVVFIPTIGPLAAIAGSVNQPAIFELKDNETLATLLNLAGGLTNVASGKKVVVERIHKRVVRKVDEFMLSEEGLAKSIHDGDLVTVSPVLARFDNAVTLRGNVAVTGRHLWREGLRVSDVIPDKEALIVNDYWLKQNQASQTDVAGADKLLNQVKHSLAEINWDYAVVERLNSHDLTTSLIPFNLHQAVIEHDAEQDLLLEPGDTITVFSKEDIQVPVAQRTKYVVLEGEVAHPGVYQVKTGETLRQLVTRVGGLSAQSYLFGSEFSRESTRKVQQARLEEIIARMEADVQRNAVQSATAGLSKDDAERSKLQAQSQEGLIAKMRQVKATGRIVLELPEDAVELNNLPELTLEDGDRYFIPNAPSTVSVMGTVYNQNAFIYRKGQNVGEYLEKSGGPTRDGDKDDVYLIRADGQVISKRQSSYAFGYGGFSGRTAMPGDVVVVPEKLDKYNFTKDLKDWTQIFYQFAFGVAAFKSIGAL